MPFRVTCAQCELNINKCICGKVDAFFKDNRELMDQLSSVDTAEFEAKPIEEQEIILRERGYPRCHGCFFFACRCSLGLLRKS